MMTPMKMMLSAILAVALALCTFSCAGTKDVMYPETAVHDSYVAYDGAIGDLVCDFSALDVSVEIADLIILGTVVVRSVYDGPDTYMAPGPRFFYEIRVDEVYYDRNEWVSKEDVIPLVSGFGFFSPEEYRDYFPEEEPIPDGTVYACTSQGGLPLMEGEQFVLMLDDMTLGAEGDEGFWQDATWSQVWGVKDGGKKLYFGAEGKRYEGDLDDLISELQPLIQARRGIMDDGIVRWKEPD